LDKLDVSYRDAGEKLGLSVPGLHDLPQTTRNPSISTIIRRSVRDLTQGPSLPIFGGRPIFGGMPPVSFAELFERFQASARLDKVIVAAKQRIWLVGHSDVRFGRENFGIQRWQSSARPCDRGVIIGDRLG
jgi:hypothetical protein